MATSDTTPRVLPSVIVFFFQTVALLLSDCSALLLKANAIEVLVDQHHVESEEDQLVRVTAAADVGLPVIGYHAYQNIVRRYRVIVEVTGRHNELLL